MKYTDNQIKAAARAWERLSPYMRPGYAEESIRYLVERGHEPLSQGERAAMMSLVGRPLPEDLRALRFAERSSDRVPEHWAWYLRSCEVLGWVESLGDGRWRVTPAGQRVMRAGGDGHRFRP